MAEPHVVTALIEGIDAGSLGLGMVTGAALFAGVERALAKLLYRSEEEPRDGVR